MNKITMRGFFMGFLLVSAMSQASPKVDMAESLPMPTEGQDSSERASQLRDTIKQIIANHKLGDLQKTEELLDQIKSLNLNRAAAHFVASTYLNIGKPGKALELLIPLLTEDPEPQVMVVAGLAFAATGKQFLAENWLKTAANSDTEKEPVKMAYVNWLMENKRYLDAYEWLDNKLDGPPPVYKPWLARYAQSAVLAKRVDAANVKLERISGSSPEASWMRTLLYGQSGQWTEALSAADKALSEDAEDRSRHVDITPTLSKALNYFSAQKDWPKAIKAADLLLSIDASRIDWLEARLRLTLNQGDYARAEELVASWRHLDASQNLGLQGDIALAKGNLQRAEENYHNAWKAAPSMSLAKRMISLGGQLGTDGSIALIRAWAEDDAKNPEAQLTLAMSESTAGRDEQAIAAYHALINLTPENWVAHNNLAWLYSKNSAIDKALVHALQAAKINPKSAVVMDTTAWMYHLNGQKEEAIKWAQLAINNAPNNAEIQNHFEIINRE